MLDIRQEAASAVVTDLGPFEASVDIALAQCGRLLATLTQSRLEAHVAPAVGHKAIMSALATITALGQAREGMVDTRRELILTRAKLGMQEMAMGSLMGCPESSAPADATVAIAA